MLERTQEELKPPSVSVVEVVLGLPRERAVRDRFAVLQSAKGFHDPPAIDAVGYAAAPRLSFCPSFPLPRNAVSAGTKFIKRTGLASR